MALANACDIWLSHSNTLFFFGAFIFNLLPMFLPFVSVFRQTVRSRYSRMFCGNQRIHLQLPHMSLDGTLCEVCSIHDFFVRRHISVFLKILDKKSVNIISGRLSLIIFPLTVIHTQNGSSSAVLLFSARILFNLSAAFFFVSSEYFLGGLILM